ncbi:hypothetical protein C8F01DRAFT_1155815 [Mycena amicta]|nr:hypothetical protein C8F01DRAFT_1155815 [Mycena amicta]
MTILPHAIKHMQTCLCYIGGASNIEEAGSWIFRILTFMMMGSLCGRFGRITKGSRAPWTRKIGHFYSFYLILMICHDLLAVVFK